MSSCASAVFQSITVATDVAARACFIFKSSPNNSPYDLLASDKSRNAKTLQLEGNRVQSAAKNIAGNSFCHASGRQLPTVAGQQRLTSAVRSCGENNGFAACR